MGLLPNVETSEVHGSAMAQSPVRICMHVLGTVRDDVRVMREAAALVEAGFSVFIIDVESESSLPVEERVHNICVKHIIRPSWFVPTRFKPWFLVKFVSMIIRSAFLLVRSSVDIYHAQDLTALPACYIASRIRRKPLIFDAHELPLSDIRLRRWHRLHAQSARFLAGMLPHCAGIITVSSPIAQEISKSYSVSNVSLVRNVPAYRSVPKSDRLRQYLGLGPEVRIALYQGNVRSDRELDRLIRAAPFLGPNILIALMGPTTEAMQAQLEALISSEGVAERVKILPPVPYEELLDWTASADIGLIIYSPDSSLNMRMCLPNKLFEYLMAGAPVLASELEAVVEVIKTYNVGQVVSSLTPADIGSAITAMLSDHVALAHMHRDALEVAQRQFCWEREKQHLIQFYQNILEMRSA